tara:strand:- start:249 stop:1025 length:777 start_codon:yes stop_codon:yes gene_type:complete
MDNTTNEDSANIEGVQGEVLESDVNQIVEIEDGPVVVQESADIGDGDDAKKFQSMYDRKTAEYDKLNGEVKDLRKYQQLGDVLKNRPDVVDAMRQTLGGTKQEAPVKENGVDEDSFDPWDAYYKEGSPSYEMRVGQQKAFVEQAVEKRFAGVQEQMALTNLKQELSTKYGMEESSQVDEFLEFATKPRDEVPLDILIDVYRKHRGPVNKATEANIAAVQRSQALPTTAGIVQGGAAKKPSEIDDVWGGIMSVSNRNKI